eukprot:809670-Pyramimonas_sp.AAC.2
MFHAESSPLYDRVAPTTQVSALVSPLLLLGVVALTPSEYSAQGELNPQLAFMTGKLKLKGNMGLGLKLGK